jgi:hypothetical protein
LLLSIFPFGYKAAQSAANSRTQTKITLSASERIKALLQGYFFYFSLSTLILYQKFFDFSNFGARGAGCLSKPFLLAPSLYMGYVRFGALRGAERLDF